ncbi:MAG: hypothetical protein JNM93_11545 [Bacteriovoracaceae bacterium]|nr:hypothetical protein [Bacteriovoracaceae bacterium]
MILLLKMMTLLTFANTATPTATTPAQTLKYTEADFVEKVKEEVTKKIDDIKKKSVTDLTKELVAKEAELKIRENELKVREEQMGLTSKDLDQKIKDFDKKQMNFIGCIDQNEKKKAERIRQLVSVVSGMKPAKAAELLSVQDSEISVKILAELDSEKASKIFNLMDKEISARLQKQYLDMKR